MGGPPLPDLTPPGREAHSRCRCDRSRCHLRHTLYPQAHPAPNALLTPWRAPAHTSGQVRAPPSSAKPVPAGTHGPASPSLPQSTPLLHVSCVTRESDWSSASLSPGCELGMRWPLPYELGMRWPLPEPPSALPVGSDGPRLLGGLWGKRAWPAGSPERTCPWPDGWDTSGFVTQSFPGPQCPCSCEGCPSAPLRGLWQWPGVRSLSWPLLAPRGGVPSEAAGLRLGLTWQASDLQSKYPAQSMLGLMSAPYTSGLLHLWSATRGTSASCRVLE